MSAEWVKLADFGEYEHKKGIQILNEKSANNIIKSFHSLHGRFMRKFIGLPIYIGHPDDDDFKSSNKKVYGRVVDFKAEDDALWALIKWTHTGHVLFSSGILKHLSPRWLTVQSENGALIPNRMISIGMTNHPNIRCDNIVKDNVAEDGDQEIHKNIDFDQPAYVDATEVSAQDTRDLQDFPSSNCGDKGNSFCEGDTGDNKHNCSDTCECVRPELHVISHTKELAHHDFQMSDGDKILELVFSRMNNFSEKYTDAWIAVKRNNPSLFYKNF